MTALEYMEKQLQKRRNNYDCELLRGVPEEMLQNIQQKIGYYEAAVKALKREPVRVGYWTGSIPEDFACAEGRVLFTLEEYMERDYEATKHHTHCSNCNAGFDDRQVTNWKCCPLCETKMVGTTMPDSDLLEIKALADLSGDSDLEHMTRFAMQRAINKK